MAGISYLDDHLLPPSHFSWKAGAEVEVGLDRKHLGMGCECPKWQFDPLYHNVLCWLLPYIVRYLQTILIKIQTD